MKERPILFNAPMVRAILDGRKTQTRRVVKPQPAESFESPISCGLYAPIFIDKDGDAHPGADVFGFGDENSGWVCPYGQPGDKLWIKETFARVPGGPESLLMPSRMFPGEMQCSCVYRASCIGENSDFKPAGGWKPSIFLPRWASRIALEVTGVRVERVQEISDQDAIREGIIGEWFDVVKDVSARASFARLWDSINAKRGCGWAANPWAWVVGFKREEAVR